ncbi:DUF4397 domain-containing protein [Mucilaginibacter panaciglaebae]|uniref:DUF4397 domain-containing protein n=1 Tax=Mucilaginibacter panaciglaebae TaxID=502331 RepID=A0ABP7WUT5_9SPHI
MNSKIILLILFVAIAGVFACKKDGEKVGSVTQNEITLINASSDTLNVYENGARINNGSTLLPSGQYRNLEIIAGNQHYQFKKAGNPNALFDIGLNFDFSSSYTLFVAGQSADKVFVLKDTVNRDTLRSAYVRYINASPDAGNIDFTIGSLPTLKSLSFKSATSFLSVPAGKVFYSMVKDGTDTIAAGTLTFNSGVAYNLFTKGLVNGKGTNALGARVLIAQ